MTETPKAVENPDEQPERRSFGAKKRLLADGTLLISSAKPEEVYELGN